MSPLFAFAALLLCLVVSAQSFSLFPPSDLQCTSKSVDTCMARTNGKKLHSYDYCQAANSAYKCLMNLLRNCYSPDDPAFLNILASYDLSDLHQYLQEHCKE